MNECSSKLVAGSLINPHKDKQSIPDAAAMMMYPLFNLSSLSSDIHIKNAAEGRRDLMIRDLRRLHVFGAGIHIYVH
eukprot:scaffold6562_cov163-Amphora_coffeaeformis.AAC.13